MERYKTHRMEEMIVLNNKQPQWNEDTQVYFDLPSLAKVILVVCAQLPWPSYSGVSQKFSNRPQY